MSSRAFLKDRLLWRELSSQAHRRFGWSYPGPSWFLTATLLTPTVFWKLSPTHEPWSSLECYCAASMWQLWLLSLRSMIYSSVSMAHEFREGTLPVLRSTPVSLGRALTVKLVACLMPLWAELGLLGLLNLAFYGLLGGLPTSLVLGTLLLMASTSLFFGGFGLWLGALANEPERAAGWARIVVAMLLVGTYVLARALTWPLLLVGAVIWMVLAVQPQARPGQGYQGSVPALVLLLFLPVLYTFAQSYLSDFEFSAYNPLSLLLDCAQGGPTGPALDHHLGPLVIAYLAGGALFSALTASRARAQI